MPPELTIIERLRQTNVSRSDKYTARQLLDLVDDVGHIRIEYDAALQVAELNQVDTLRGHLSRLKQVGIIANYHCNGAVDITFAGYPPRAVSTEMLRHRALARGGRAEQPADQPDEQQTAETQRAATSQICDDSARQRAASARETPETDPPHYISALASAPELVGWLVGSISDPELPTNQPAEPTANSHQPPEPVEPAETDGAPISTIDPVQAAQSYALLIAIRMKSSNAKKFSDSLPFATVRQYVARWWFDRKSIGGRFDESPGILARWLDSPDEYPLQREFPLAMLAEIHQAALTPAEQDTIEQAQPPPEPRFDVLSAARDPEPIDLMPDPPSDPGGWQSADELWDAVCDAVELPAFAKQTWLSGGKLWRNGDSFCLELASHQVEHVNQRFRPALRRIIAAQTGLACSAIKFEITHN